MSDKIESLKHSVERKEQQIQKLQEAVKKQKGKIRGLEKSEILSNLNSLSAQGYPVKKIISAIYDKNADALIRLMDEVGSKDESGSGSATANDKEDKGNEQSV